MSLTLEIWEAIASPLVHSLLTTHPNEAVLCSCSPPPSWASWWDWAATAPRWRELWAYYTRSCAASPSQAAIPPDLCALVDAVRALQLPRAPAAPVPVPASAGGGAGAVPPRGMSPKKAHEVARMAAFVRALLDGGGAPPGTHAVDVGAGQGHLARALRAAGLHVLALDRRANGAGDEDGAARGSLAHRTVDVRGDTLAPTVAAWLCETPRRSPSPPNVVLVALHACGALAVDALRAFVAQRRQRGAAWAPHSLVVVGCCYHLAPTDFPLSARLRTRDPGPALPLAALHLAAQVPAQWFRTERAACRTALAVRKVVYRALLQPALHGEPGQKPGDPGLGETPASRRLGRLNDAAYADWPTFVVRASAKMAIDPARLTAAGWLAPASTSTTTTTTTPVAGGEGGGGVGGGEEGRQRMERRLEVLHVLRCIVGPLVESLILLDRLEWLREELAGEPVELVNLFDQATGSGRNVALVVRPARRACTT